MNKSKIKKYVGKHVKVYFRYGHKPAIGDVVYRPKEPLCDYFLYQKQNSGSGTIYLVALEPKMIGHIEIER